MSRSYRKNIRVTDGRAHTTKYIKNLANRKVRRSTDVPDGASHKRVYESWDIRDYRKPWSWEDAKKMWEESSEDEYIRKRFPTLKRYHRHWLQSAKMK